jgi:hypothetical protein
MVPRIGTIFPEAKSAKSLIKLIQNDIKAKNLLKLTRLL